MSDIVTAQGVIIGINNDDDYDDVLFIINSAIIIYHVPPYLKPMGFSSSDTKS